MPGMLEGKVALVTGASSGIGRGAALAFAGEGAKVVVAARRTGEGEGTVREIKALGGEALFVKTDVSKGAEIEALVRRTVEAYGRLDCALNNAGVLEFAPAAELAEEAWDETIAVNLKGVWLSMKHEISAMLRQEPTGGAIVNTSSWLAVGGLPGSAAYSASKAGVDGLVRPAAIEYARAGIRINNVAPGGIDTEMTRYAFRDAEALENFAAAHPGGRLGTPEEVAQTVVWLCSDRASFVTGQSLLVDGGYAVPGQRAS